MAWDPPSDSDLAADKPAKASHARRVRDLFAALAARDTGAPPSNGRGAYTVLRAFSRFGDQLPNPDGSSLRGFFVVPDFVYRLELIVVGGGGAGGQGTNTVIGTGGVSPGGGGGAGDVNFGVMEVLPGQVIPVTLGPGGDPDEISQWVDTTLDEFEIGDGGRTTFGVGQIGVTRFAARGGKRGYDGDGSSTDGEGGDGGGGIEEDGVTFQPWVAGAKGGRAFRTVPGGDGPARSGSGARSLIGAGGAAITANGIGNSADSRGAGGSGGYPAGSGTSANGGNGGHGIVIVRY